MRLPNDQFRDCFSDHVADCPFAGHNEYGTPCCTIDCIVQTRYYGCVPQEVINKISRQWDEEDADEQAAEEVTALTEEIKYYAYQLDLAQERYRKLTGRWHTAAFFNSGSTFKPKAERIVEEIWDALYGEGIYYTEHASSDLEPDDLILIDELFNDNDWSLD